ncbi:putative pumilio homology domain family member 6 [Blattamonas nauphoetae]|uniref:Pumilio homology domain family member 6 n=1 Tax=Blattamonas nauphoetae TaxID=2049346 RepID=A0ABQ9Y9I0_9EUKA|nr:putative pumilio homology domain family member 6 [Blattamonas nauphoetae]
MKGKTPERKEHRNKIQGIVTEGKNDWIKLTGKKEDKAARERRAQRLYALMKGTIPACCQQHETARYVQAVVKYGTEQHRKAVVAELHEHFHELAVSRYGAHVITAILRCGGRAEKDLVIVELMPHTYRLIRHKIGSLVIDSLYRSHCSSRQQLAFEAQIWTHHLASEEPGLPSGLALGKNAITTKTVTKQVVVKRKKDDKNQPKKNATPITKKEIVYDEKTRKKLAIQRQLLIGDPSTGRVHKNTPIPTVKQFVQAHPDRRQMVVRSLRIAAESMINKELLHRSISIFAVKGFMTLATPLHAREMAKSMRGSWIHIMDDEDGAQITLHALHLRLPRSHVLDLLQSMHTYVSKILGSKPGSRVLLFLLLSILKEPCHLNLSFPSINIPLHKLDFILNEIDADLPSLLSAPNAINTLTVLVNATFRQKTEQTVEQLIRSQLGAQAVTLMSVPLAGADYNIDENLAANKEKKERERVLKQLKGDNESDSEEHASLGEDDEEEMVVESDEEDENEDGEDRAARDGAWAGMSSFHSRFGNVLWGREVEDETDLFVMKGQNEDAEEENESEDEGIRKRKRRKQAKEKKAKKIQETKENPPLGVIVGQVFQAQLESSTNALRAIALSLIRSILLFFASEKLELEEKDITVLPRNVIGGEEKPKEEGLMLERMKKILREVVGQKTLVWVFTWLAEEQNKTNEHVDEIRRTLEPLLAEAVCGEFEVLRHAEATPKKKKGSKIQEQHYQLPTKQEKTQKGEEHEEESEESASGELSFDPFYHPATCVILKQLIHLSPSFAAHILHAMNSTISHTVHALTFSVFSDLMHPSVHVLTGLADVLPAQVCPVITSEMKKHPNITVETAQGPMKILLRVVKEWKKS